MLDPKKYHLDEIKDVHTNEDGVFWRPLLPGTYQVTAEFNQISVTKQVIKTF